MTNTEVFDKWFKKLRDRQAALAIANRITHATGGNLGDVKPIGEGVSEMRIFVGKGYRIYFCMKGVELVVLLCGGNKTTQSDDIAKAKQLAKEV